MPKQRVLKFLDPDGIKTVEELQAELAPLARLYRRVVIQDEIPAGMGVEEQLGVYRNWHMLTFRAEWEENEIPVACTCQSCFNNGVCGDTLLYAAVFEPRVRVPDDYITKSVHERKGRKSARGTAGKNRMRILADRFQGQEHEGKSAATSPRPARQARRRPDRSRRGQRGRRRRRQGRQGTTNPITCSV